MRDRWLMMSDKGKGIVITFLLFLLVIAGSIWYAVDYYPTPDESLWFLAYIPFLLDTLPILAFVLLVVGGFLYFKYDNQYGLGLMVGILYSLFGILVFFIAIEFLLFIIGIIFVLL